MEKTQIQVIRKKGENTYWKKEPGKELKWIHPFEYWKLFDKSFQPSGKSIEVLPPVMEEKIEIFEGEVWDTTRRA